jgi:hypothetical protein
LDEVEQRASAEHASTDGLERNSVLLAGHQFRHHLAQLCLDEPGSDKALEFNHGRLMVIQLMDRLEKPTSL